MDHLTFESVVRMSLELSLGICIKLFCDNGRIHWRDFLNDMLFWLPGVRRQAGDGLSREAAAMVPDVAVMEDHSVPALLAAK